MTANHPPQITDSPQDTRHNKAGPPPPRTGNRWSPCQGRWLIYRPLVLSSAEEPSSGAQPSPEARQHETICMCHCAHVGNRWEAFCRGRGVHYCISQGGSGDSSNEPAPWNQPPSSIQDRRRGWGWGGGAPAALAAITLQSLTRPESSPSTSQPQASPVS